MADLTSTLTREIVGWDSWSTQIANGLQMVPGNVVGLRGPEHATTQGYLDHYDNEVGMIMLGGVVGGDTANRLLGNTSALPPPKASVQIQPQIFKGVAVTGAASRADIGKYVFMTDANVWTLTYTALAEVAGVIVEWHSSTICDVLMFGGVLTMCRNSLVELLYLGHFDANTITAANIRTAFPAPYHAKVLSVFAMIDVAIAGAGATALINLEIGATNVTGGVVTIAENDAKGTLKAGTAVTDDATAIMHEGDAIDIEAATVTDATAGTFDLYAKVLRLAGV